MRATCRKTDHRWEPLPHYDARRCIICGHCLTALDIWWRPDFRGWLHLGWPRRGR